MSKYSDRTPALFSWFGTALGYNRYDDGTVTLTERVRRNPYSIILLDELKRRIHKWLLLPSEVLDDGRLTDGQGIQSTSKARRCHCDFQCPVGYESRLGRGCTKETDRWIKAQAYFTSSQSVSNAVVGYTILRKDNLMEIVNLMLIEASKPWARRSDLAVSVAGPARAGYDQSWVFVRQVIEQQNSYGDWLPAGWSGRCGTWQPIWKMVCLVAQEKARPHPREPSRQNKH